MSISVLTFGVIHSSLARDYFKLKFRYRYYAILYYLISIVSFSLLMIIERVLIPFGTTNTDPIIDFPLLGNICFLFGCIFFFGGMFQLYFMKIFQESHLNTIGLYAFARHPIYFGGIALLLSVSVFRLSNSIQITNAFSLALYLFIGSLVEDFFLSKSEKLYPLYIKVCGLYFPWKLTHLRYFFQNFIPINRKNEEFLFR